MQSVGPDITEHHLPERWAVLEEALRQLSAESGAHYPGDLPENTDSTDFEL